MNPLEIVIPIIWAGGLIGLGALFAKSGDRFPLVNFFPAAGFLGLLIYGFGLAGIWGQPLFIILTILLTIALIWTFSNKTYRRRLLDFIRSHRLFSAAFGVTLAWFGLASLSYPVSTDALYFHLGLPKLYAESGRMFFTPGILFSAGPRAMEMITTGFYFLGLERGAQLFIVLIAAVLILAIYLKASDFGANGIYATLIFVSVPIVISQLTGSKNDYLLWGLSFFACLKFIEFLQTGKSIQLLWAAIGVGLAAGTKSIGLGLLGALAIIMLYEVIFGKTSIRQLGLFLGVAFLLLSPWYIYSWVVTGNPVFPFFDTIFHSPQTGPLFEQFNAALAIERISPNLVNLLISPVLLIFAPELYDGRLGYALILFPCLLLILPRIPYKVKLAAGISIVFFAIWYFGFAFARFLLPAGPLLAIVGAHFISRAAEITQALKLAAVGSLTIAVLLPIPGVIRDTAPRALSVIKNTPKFEFLRGHRALDPYQTRSGETAASIPYIECWRFINENTPDSSKIGILTSFVARADGYYLDRDFIYLNPSEQVQFDFTRLRDWDNMARDLRTFGITHVVVDSVVASQFTSGSDWSDFPGFEAFSSGVSTLISYLQGNAKIIFKGSRFIIYEI
jgi:hypothetical protein